MWKMEVFLEAYQSFVSGLNSSSSFVHIAVRAAPTGCLGSLQGRGTALTALLLCPCPSAATSVPCKGMHILECNRTVLVWMLFT